MKPKYINDKETIYKLYYCCDGNGNISNKILFPELFPISIKFYQGRDIFEVFIFNSDGSLFKFGFCKPEYILDWSTGEEICKPFEGILETKLYKNIYLTIEQDYKFSIHPNNIQIGFKL